MQRLARVALITEHDPANGESFSGTPRFVVDALRRRGHEVVWVGPKHRYGPIRDALIARLAKFGVDTERRRNPRFESRAAARQVAPCLSAQEFDVALGLVASVPLAAMQLDLPLVYASDTVFAVMDGYYDYTRSLPPRLRDEFDRCERHALTRADAVLMPSSWARDAAVERYGIDPSRVTVTPYGANLRSAPPSRTRQLLVEDELRLLFISKEDWHRKGGPEAIETVRILRSRGLRVRLHVVGMHPHGVRPEPGVEIVGYLRKSVPEEGARFDQLLSDAHFMFQPTKAETWGIVFCEAAAHALPVISRRTGGVPEVVLDGISGALLPQDATPPDFADAIERLAKEPERYATFSREARKRFEDVLNWDTWARVVSATLDRVAFRP